MRAATIARGAALAAVAAVASVALAGALHVRSTDRAVAVPQTAPSLPGYDPAAPLRPRSRFAPSDRPGALAFRLRNVTLAAQGQGVVAAGERSDITCDKPSCRFLVPSFGPVRGLTLMATPRPGSTFVRWEGVCTGTDPTCFLGLGADRSAVAVFEPVPVPAAPSTLAVTQVGAGVDAGTIVSDPGGISCPPDCLATFEPGTSVALTSLNQQTQRIAQWTGCQPDVADATRCTLTVPETPPSSPRATARDTPCSSCSSARGRWWRPRSMRRALRRGPRRSARQAPSPATSRATSRTG